MAQQKFQDQQQEFEAGGLETTRTPDKLPEGRYPYVLNVAPVRRGVLQPRPGTQTLATLPAAVHSIKRVNNQLPGSPNPTRRFVGAGGSLYTDQNKYAAALDTGFSGNPLSFATYRPSQSPETWLYIADALQMRKYKTDGQTAQNWGIFPAPKPPTVELQNRAWETVANTIANTNWSNGGAAGSISVQNRVPAGTTAAAVLFDSGNTGYASIALASATASNWLGANATYTLDNGETVLAEEVFTSLGASNITGIAYDNGAGPGLCTIQLTTSIDGLRRNQVVLLNSATPEYVRVLSVTVGPDQSYSFRCSTVNVQAATATATALCSFRAFCTATHGAGAAISVGMLQSNFTGSSGTTSTGTMTLTGSNLTQNLKALNGRPLTDDDYLHISIAVSDPTQIVQGRILLDVDSATNDFAHNYYYIAFQANDFQFAATGANTQLSIMQQAIQRQQVSTTPLANYYNEGGMYAEEAAQTPAPGSTYGAQPIQKVATPAALQAMTGTSAWTEFHFKLGDLQRVGNDNGRNLSTVMAFRVELTITANVTVQIASAVVFGTYGPDIQATSFGYTGVPYIYASQFRSSATGARSLPSPIIRTGVLPERQAVKITPLTSADPQVDFIDIFRLGGTLSQQLYFVGSIANNPTTPQTFIDSYTDDYVEVRPKLITDQNKPFPVTDQPRAGVCNVVGTTVTGVSGDVFNTNWAPGTQILIAGVAYTLHGMPASATQLFLEQNAFYGTNLSWQIPEPTIMGYPLPLVWGPVDGVLFGCGDSYNPGFVYPTRPDDPDGASDKDPIEVTDPSEPILNGIDFDDVSFCFSNKRAFRLEATQQGWQPVELGINYGLFARRGLAKGPFLWYVTNDGIVQMAPGGGAQLITDAIENLFPRGAEPVPAYTVAGQTIYPPDYTQPDSMRLSYGNNWLYFDFLDTNGQRATLAYFLVTQSWWYWLQNAEKHYQEEGAGVNSVLIASGNNLLIQQSENGDSNNAIPCVVVTRAFDAGNSRSSKRFGDLYVSSDGTAAISCQPGYDNFTVLDTVQTITNATLDLSGGAGSALHRNLGLILSWQSKSTLAATEHLYFWQVSWLDKGPATLLRQTDWDDLGSPGFWFLEGLRIRVDTHGVARSFYVLSDTGQQTPVFTIISGGDIYLSQSFTPITGHLFRIVPTAEADTWNLIDVQWIAEVQPEPALIWATQPTTHGLEGYLHHRDAQWVYGPAAAAVSFTVTADGLSSTYALPATAIVKKLYWPFPPIKGKLVSYQLSSAQPFALYRNQTEMRVKQWGSTGPYQIVHPFGEVSLTQGGPRL